MRAAAGERGYDAAMSTGVKVLTWVAAALVAFGAVSSHRIHDSEATLVIHEGALYSEVCHFGWGSAGDDLDAFGEWQATGRMGRPPAWRCERTINVLQVEKLGRPINLIYWLTTLLCVVAGLATAATLLLGLRGPRRRRSMLIAVVTLGAGIVLLALAILDGTALSRISYGAVAYLVGAVIAIVLAKPGLAPDRDRAHATGSRR
jgi:hypothetical protein